MKRSLKHIFPGTRGKREVTDNSHTSSEWIWSEAALFNNRVYSPSKNGRKQHQSLHRVYLRNNVDGISSHYTYQKKMFRCLSGIQTRPKPKINHSDCPNARQIIDVEGIPIPKIVGSTIEHHLLFNTTLMQMMFIFFPAPNRSWISLRLLEITYFIVSLFNEFLFLFGKTCPESLWGLYWRDLILPSVVDVVVEGGGVADQAGKHRPPIRRNRR